MWYHIKKHCNIVKVRSAIVIIIKQRNRLIIFNPQYVIKICRKIGEVKPSIPINVFI